MSGRQVVLRRCPDEAPAHCDAGPVRQDGGDHGCAGGTPVGLAVPTESVRCVCKITRKPSGVYRKARDFI